MVKTLIREKYKPIPFLIPSELDKNISIFLYGRTNSGKSYTVLEILKCLPSSFVDIDEIYLNKKTRLYSSDEKLEGKEIVKKFDELRRVKRTAGNESSSRSVMVLELQTNGYRLRLIDLMGSEQAQDRVGRENNKHLLSLHRCVSALKNGSSHIPFGDYTLTRLFKECVEIGEVVFIGCVDTSDEIETKRTYDFLSLVRVIDTSRFQLPQPLQTPISREESEDEIKEQLLREKFLKSFAAMKSLF